MSTPLGPAGWHPDPVGRYEYRYYNGSQWTADVAVQGQRFIDPAGAPVWSDGWQSGGPTPPKRGMALASFVIALVSLLGAWLPFLFVFAAVGAILAFIFGIAALRSPAGREGHGRGMATAGIILSVLAALLCIVGFAFSVVVWREVRAYIDPGPHTLDITRCEISAGEPMRMEGTITNDDPVATHDFTLDIEYLVRGDSVRSETIVIDDLAPGEARDFESDAFVVGAGPLECRVTVYGPTPFGFDQEDLNG